MNAKTPEATVQLLVPTTIKVQGEEVTALKTQNEPEHNAPRQRQAREKYSWAFAHALQMYIHTAVRAAVRI